MHDVEVIEEPAAVVAALDPVWGGLTERLLVATAGATDPSCHAVTDEQRRHTEQRIRAGTDALLRGEFPPNGKCDITTLAQQAGISRAALYRSYPHLKAEFANINSPSYRPTDAPPTPATIRSPA